MRGVATPHSLSPTRAKAVLRPCRPYLPEQAAAVIYLQVAEGVRIAVAEREFAERAVAEARKKGVLTPEQIKKVLALEDEGE